MRPRPQTTHCVICSKNKTSIRATEHAENYYQGALERGSKIYRTKRWCGPWLLVHLFSGEEVHRLNGEVELNG
ncbi:hypothetical protein K443DRAFT_476599 [Laccaria amethystina LaAM-08-1]|uniref:Uncharacterized protein n=1 Tax=Laccaria amethystina LaAM-08-1 TaxID=1095629 RepID=A0A0C9XEX0_9AGAR|nr:hypothetical protein K443DRAFT_476599 [Laccaria amethystina LaAM-08-1]